jgi:hypothetical protein
LGAVVRGLDAAPLGNLPARGRRGSQVVVATYFIHPLVLT